MDVFIRVTGKGFARIITLPLITMSARRAQGALSGKKSGERGRKLDRWTVRYVPLRRFDATAVATV